MAFNKDVFAAALSVEFAGKGFNGSEQIVPGATVLFSGFLVGNLGFSIFREHGWGTWERLRASQLSTPELLVAKSVAPILSLAIQLVVLLVGGTLLFDLQVRGSLLAFAGVAAALAIMEVTLGFILLSLRRSVIQLNALTNAGAMLLGAWAGRSRPSSSSPAGPGSWPRPRLRTGPCGASGRCSSTASVSRRSSFPWPSCSAFPWSSWPWP